MSTRGCTPHNKGAHTPALDRLFRLTRIGPGEDCWIWKGGTSSDGYGRIRGDGECKTMPAHHVTYKAFIGEIPEGMVTDHLCRNPSCVNPWHLELVTNRENVLRGVGVTAENARKTHCIRGHEFTPENTVPGPRGGRGCRSCRRETQRDRRRRKREAALVEAA